MTARLALSLIVTLAGAATVVHKHRHQQTPTLAVSALPSASDALAERVSRSRERTPLPGRKPPTPRPTRQRPSHPHLRPVHNWEAVAQCESSGNWHINTGNGFYGGLQFLLSTWRSFGGSGQPDQASEAEQIRVAERILAVQGIRAWPVCGRFL